MAKFLTTWSIKVSDLGSHTLENLRAQAIASEKSIGALQKDMTALRNEAKDSEQAAAALNKQLGKAKDQSEIDAISGQMETLKAKAGAARQAADVLEAAIIMKGGTKSLHQLSLEAGMLKGKLKAAMDPADRKALLADLNKVEREIKDINAELNGTHRQSHSRFGKMAANLKGSLMDIPGVGGAIGAMTNPIGAVALGLGAVVAGIGSIVAESLALRDVRNRIQAVTATSAAMANSITADAAAIGDVFQADAELVAQAANTLNKQMGESFAEGFTLIKKGFQAGAGQELLTDVQQLGPVFHDAGASAKEFFSLMASASQTGAFKGKVLESVFQFTQKIREFTPDAEKALADAFGSGFTADLKKRIQSGATPAFAALKEVMAKVKGTNMDVQKLQVLTGSLFGAKAEKGTLQGIMGAFENMEKGIDNLIDASSDLVQDSNVEIAAKRDLHAAQLKLAEAADPLADKWEVLKTKMLTGVIPAIEGMIDVLNKLMGNDLESRVVKASSAYVMAESQWQQDQALLAADEETQAQLIKNEPLYQKRIQEAEARRAEGQANAAGMMTMWMNAAGISNNTIARLSAAPAPPNNSPMLGGGRTEASPQSMNQVRSVEAQTKHINVTIHKMVETLEVNAATLPQAATQVRMEVDRMMTDGVRDWEETY